MVLHRKYTLAGDVTTLDWSSDSSILIGGDRDKINDRDQIFAGSGNTGSNLTGKLVARCYTISEDGVISQGNAAKKKTLINLMIWHLTD
eukprot:scaffold24383_cov39-Cyclotella_meneghiniana.AAC.6